MPLLLSSLLCVEVGTVADEVVKAELIGTIFFVSGIITFLQTIFGSRYLQRTIFESFSNGETYAAPSH